MNNNKGYLFMAFAKGAQSTSGTGEFKKYIGVAPVNILSVNPNKAEWEKLTGRQADMEISYLGSAPDSTPQVRISFFVRTDKDFGVDMSSQVTFFLNHKVRYNRDNTKCQVIDKYGRTAWVTVEQAKNHEIPVYSNGNPANIDKDYRPCYVGEEELTNFIINYLNIPSVQQYKNGVWVLRDNPEDCEARLSEIENYFKGDFKELKEILAYQPNNAVKVLFGIRTSNEGKQYQAAYTQITLKNWVKDYSKLAKDVEARKAAGAYSTTEFEVCDLKEYAVTPTDLSSQPVSSAPSPFNPKSDDSDLPW